MRFPKNILKGAAALMTWKKMHLKLPNGGEADVELKYTIRTIRDMNIAKTFKFKHPETLVLWNKYDCYVTLDTGAPTWYIELATLHEMICMGGLYTELVGQIPEDEKHCWEVEKFVLSVAGKHRAQYIDWRIKMIHEILDNKLPTTAGECLKYSLTMFEEELANLSDDERASLETQAED